MTWFTSPKQNKTARSIPNPKEPLRRMLVIMERGTLIAGFSISSDIC